MLERHYGASEHGCVSPANPSEIQGMGSHPDSQHPGDWNFAPLRHPNVSDWLSATRLDSLNCGLSATRLDSPNCGLSSATRHDSLNCGLSSATRHD